MFTKLFFQKRHYFVVWFSKWMLKHCLCLRLKNTDNAVEALTQFSVSIGDQLLTDWFTFFGHLFVKFRDGYVTTAAPKDSVCGCNTQSVKYSGEWYNRRQKKNLVESPFFNGWRSFWLLLARWDFTWNLVGKLNLNFFNMKNLIFVEIGWGKNFLKISYWEWNYELRVGNSFKNFLLNLLSSEHF